MVPDPSGGRLVWFQPHPLQWDMYLAMAKWRRLVILKCRGAGGTVGTAVPMLDKAQWNDNMNIAVIAHTEPRCKKIFEETYLAIYNNPVIPELQRARAQGSETSQSALKFVNNSKIVVELEVTGGTISAGHYTELGLASAEDPTRAAKFLRDSLPALRTSECEFVIETTAVGNRGVLKDMWGTAYANTQMVAAGKKKYDPFDWMGLFLQWWRDPLKVRETEQPIPPDVATYLAEQQRELKIKLTDQQKWWYAWCLAEEQRCWENMHSNYPFTPEEAFASSQTGIVFAKEISDAARDGRIGHFAYDPKYPVHTAWDIGISLANGMTAIVFFQYVGNMFHVISYYEDTDREVADYLGMLIGKPWKANYGLHFGPHDINRRDPWGGKTLRESALERSLKFTPIQVCRTLEEGLLALRQAFSRICFDEAGCATLLDHLRNYRRRVDKATGAFLTGVIKTDACHGVDALRQMAQHYEGLRERTRPKRVKIEYGATVLG